MNNFILRTVGVFILFASLAFPAGALARIEIILMAQAKGVRPPPFGDGLGFRGTPFGHMALYVESATCDDEKIIRQCDEGEKGGLVLTVDKQLKDTFFIANPSDEFFYGNLDPQDLPQSISRNEIGEALSKFNKKYGQLYKKAPGESGLGQDYGILFIRKAWGLVYPTTREEEKSIIEYWQEHRHDEFHKTHNNCVTMINRSLIHAGLTKRRRFLRGHGCYNAWVHWVRKLVTARAAARAPDGDFIRRDGTFVTEYAQLKSDAVISSGRPFNAWSLLNMEYLIWLSPRGILPVTGEKPVNYKRYPTGKEEATTKFRRGFIERRFVWLLSQPYEFIRLWPQTFYGIWFAITG